MHYFVSFSVLITKHTISIVNEIKELKAKTYEIPKFEAIIPEINGPENMPMAYIA
tara:strand:- start:1 stop:165 length:165 start_codon:yes stop_codon:yes gene_type:complete